MATFQIIASRLAVVLCTAACFAALSCRNNTPHPVTTGGKPQAAKHRLAGEIVPEQRMRDMLPIRLGIVALNGVGDTSQPGEKSTDLGTQLGSIGQGWIAEHCDVAVFDCRCIKPTTIPEIRKLQKLFTGLIFTYGSSIYDQPGHHGSVGVWSPEMRSWELKTRTGNAPHHQDAGGHWLDCANASWQSYWAKHAERLAREYHADGVVVADLPVGNTFVGNNLASYHTFENKVDATTSFLQAVHHPSNFLIVPSAVGFDELVGRPTLPLDGERGEPRLVGRCWDEFDGLYDGAWAEGWVSLPWQSAVLREKDWEVQLEAADRAGKLGNVFIATLGYASADELEYGLASFLLVVHHQGRVVIQPVPLINASGGNNIAANSLRGIMDEYQKYRKYFDAPLGGSSKERKYVPVANGSVWRRSFTNGDVFVNSSDTRTVSVTLGGPMMRVTGETVTDFSLGPHTGIILIKPPK